MANLNDWKRYTFRLITKPDYSSVLKHLGENFFLDETLSAMVGDSEIKLKDFERFTNMVLDDGLSCAAFEKTTGKLAGVSVTGICRKNDDSAFHCESAEQGAIFEFLDSITEGIDLCEKYGVDEYTELIIASVDRQFRGDGLATKLYEICLELSRTSGFKLTKSAFTSPHTRRIGDKFGYQQVAMKYIREFQKQGVNVRPEAGDDEYVAVKILQL